MVNREKAVKKELTRLRKTQNPQQIDFRRMRKLRKARTTYWLTKKRTVVTPEVTRMEKEEKKKKPKKEEKKPELEVIEEPELEEIDEDLEELYTYDEDIFDDDEEDEEAEE
ncbi:MAG: hypothetical protein ACFE7R_05300 [Candidatus Hodarchaeota archaeon]